MGFLNTPRYHYQGPRVSYRLSGKSELRTYWKFIIASRFEIICFRSTAITTAPEEYRREHCRSLCSASNHHERSCNSRILLAVMAESSLQVHFRPPALPIIISN